MSDKKADTDISSQHSECANSNCLASTSRGVTRSSGDFDDVYSPRSSCSTVCSCDSRLIRKPFSIADSPIHLHKSKWQTIKHFFKKRLKNIKRRSSKSGSSDFSIERILSEESSSSREAPSEVPGWLCCTRYRPPRLPRAVNSGVCRSRRSGRHARVPFTAAQAAALEAAYARAPYLAPPALRALAAALQLRDDRIKIWFQNRRARERREKCATITPPQAVTLAPTLRSVADTLWSPHPNELPSFTNHNMFRRNLQIENSVDVYCERLVPNEERRGSIEDRPESPLDIETIDD